MASLFISHSSSDRDAAQRLEERLRAEGFAALFIDFNPEQGIPAGRNWERELYAQLRKSDAVIFLASAASVASRWCVVEVSLARALGKPVFPLRVNGDARLELLDDVQWVDLTDGERAFTQLWEGLRQAGLDPTDSFAWDPTRRPYPGLEPFAPEDAAVFFGRDQQIDRLLELVQPTLQRGAGRLVAIVGPSGSGKSSLLRAGLLPRLEHLKERWMVVPPVLPGQKPTRNLARSLAQTFSTRGHERSAAKLERHLGTGGPAALGELAKELADITDGEPNVLVVIDQAEELITRSGEREQQAFLRLLDDALAEDSPLWVMLTVRSEFLSTAPERAGLAEVVDDTLLVEPLSRARLPEVIERPAQRAGLEFEAGLVERMVEETSGGDALPLLAYTLQELWGRVGLEGTVRFADYEAVGGVVGALQRRADRLTDELTRRGQGPLILPTLLKLASVEGEEEPTRRRLRRSELAPKEQGVVDAFVEARLLTSGKSEGAGEEDAVVEVAHEALLRQWEPLRQAIEQERSSLRMRSELERLAADWDQARKEHENEDSYLLVRGRLAEFRHWADRHADELGPIEADFLRASGSFEERRIRRLRAVAGGLAILLVISVIASVLALSQTQQARSNARQAQLQANIALSRQLLAQSSGLQESQPDVSLLLNSEALLLNSEALRRAPAAVKEEARLALLDKLDRPYHISTQITGHTDSVDGVEYSPDGKLLASFSSGLDYTVRLWNVASGEPHGQPLTPRSQVWDVAFSPDGKLLASASGSGLDNAVRLWDVESGKQLGEPLTGHTLDVSAVAFSPDGELLASGGNNGVLLWDVESGKQLGEPLDHHSNWVNYVEYSPDGNLLASASEDGTVRLWDVASGKQHGEPLRGHTKAVEGIAFSPDGKLLATASIGQTVRLWDVESGKQHGEPLTGHTKSVWDVAFSPDGKLLASGSRDKTVRLWDVASGEPLGDPLEGHTDIVNHVTFSPDGKLLASASYDFTVRLWDVESRQPVGEPLAGHTAGVNDVEFSPDGKLLASASADKTVRLWDVASVEPYGQRLTGHTDWVNDVEFSPDGKLLASADNDSTVHLWNVASSRPLDEPIVAHTDMVNDVEFSPDGKLLATASADRTVRLWDVESGEQHGEPLKGQTKRGGVAFSPDGKLLATASIGQTVRLWDVESGEQHGESLKGHTYAVNDVAFSPDGKLLASAGYDETVRLWDVATSEPLGEPLKGHTDWVNDVEFSPDGKLLASAGDDETVRLWDVASVEPYGQPLEGHTYAVNGVAFSPDGKLLASASNDGTVRLWDVATGQPLGQPLTHTDMVNDVEFSPEGKMLASAGYDGTVQLWDREVESLVSEACRIANRNLSKDEWSRFVGPEVKYVRTCSRLPAGYSAER